MTVKELKALLALVSDDSIQVVLTDYNAGFGDPAPVIKVSLHEVTRESIVDSTVRPPIWGSTTALEFEIG